MRSWFVLAVLPFASALLAVRDSSEEKACVAEDSKMRVQFQNKLAGICEDMCKEVGAYPKCSQCVDFASPDDTPGVLTWDELLDHMDNLVTWGEDMIKNWKKTASALQKAAQQHVAAISVNSTMDARACQEADDQIRMLVAQKLHQVQKQLRGICVDMCKEVGSYPKCLYCKGYEADASPGRMSWDELLTHMDDLVAKDQEMLKSWGR